VNKNRRDFLPGGLGAAGNNALMIRHSASLKSPRAKTAPKWQR